MWECVSHAPHPIPLLLVLELLLSTSAALLPTLFLKTHFFVNKSGMGNQESQVMVHFSFSQNMEIWNQIYIRIYFLQHILETNYLANVNIYNSSQKDLNFSQHHHVTITSHWHAPVDSSSKFVLHLCTCIRKDYAMLGIKETIWSLKTCTTQLWRKTV